MASKKFSDQFPRDEVNVGGSRTWKINVVFLASNLSCFKGGLISESCFTLAPHYPKDYYIDGQNTQLIFLKKILLGEGKRPPNYTPGVYFLDHDLL